MPIGTCSSAEARKPGLYLSPARRGKMTPCPTAWAMPNSTGDRPSHRGLGEQDRGDVVGVGERGVDAQRRVGVEHVVPRAVAVEQPVVELAGEPARVLVFLVLVDQQGAEVRRRQR